MNALEDRLRAELRAESHLVTPDSIPALRLPGARRPGRGRPRQWGPRWWRAWAAPAAAAAAVAAVIAGTLTISGALSGAGPGRQPAAAAPYSALPSYYAVTVRGNVVSYVSKGSQDSVTVLGRRIQIRATATGKLLATVSPPSPYNDFRLLAGSADGRTFVFGARRYWGFRGARSPHTGALDLAAPIRFVMVRITPGGRVLESGVTLPFTVLPAQEPSIALSPDARRLAVAYGGGGQTAALRVVTLATGVVRQWQWPHVSWTPLLRQQGAWSGDDRTLVLQQWYVTRGANGSTPKRDTPDGTTPVWVLDTAAPGGPGQAARGFLLLRPPAGLAACGQPFLTPGGGELIAACGKSTGVPPFGPSRGEFAVYSARTGALIRTEAPWTWNGLGGPGGRAARPARGPGMGPLGPSPQVAWSDPAGARLLVEVPHDGANRLGVLTGGTLRFTGGGLLPSRPAAYAALQNAVAHASAIPAHMAW